MPEPFTSRAPRVDPITLEIIRGSLASAIRDMELLMERCAMSPFIKEKKDYFVG
ncbi:MAG: hydantoinase B/oxoprolinase family protein, partial [Candidatus Rokuibacteriota bacterium]